MQDTLNRPTTKVCGCGRELARTASQCACGHVFGLEVICVDFTDHELLLAKLRDIGKPEVVKWEALADRYALALYRAEYC